MGVPRGKAIGCCEKDSAKCVSPGRTGSRAGWEDAQEGLAENNNYFVGEVMRS